MLEDLTRRPDRRFRGVVDAAARAGEGLAPDAGLEVVVIDGSGEVVVHLRRQRDAGAGPLTTVYGSAFKPVAAVAMLEIAGELGLDVDAPLSGAGVRLVDERTTLRHVLEHRAGLPHIRALAPTAPDLGDEPELVDAVRRLEPLWPAGTTSAYHAVSYGLVLQAVCEDLLGTPLVEEIERRVLGPAGVGPTDLRLTGDAETGESRRRPSFVVGEPKIKWKADGTALYHRCCFRLEDLVAFLNARATNQGAPLSCGVAGTAMGLARFYAAVTATSDDGPFGKVTRSVLASTPETRMDRLLYQRVAWRGGCLEGAGLAPDDLTRTVIGMSGFGGPIGFCDPRTGIACGVVTDQVDAGAVVGHAAREIAEGVLRAAA